ncbi:hypothetical protein ACFE04_032024 [Oxalis oulophora]
MEMSSSIKFKGEGITRGLCFDQIRFSSSSSRFMFQHSYYIQAKSQSLSFGHPSNNNNRIIRSKRMLRTRRDVMSDHHSYMLLHRRLHQQRQQRQQQQGQITKITKLDMIRKPSPNILSDMDDLPLDFTSQHSVKLFQVFQAQPTSFKTLFKHMITNGIQSDIFIKKRVMLSVLVTSMLIHARNQIPTHDSIIPWMTTIAGLLDSLHDLDSCPNFQRHGYHFQWGEITFSSMILAAAAFQLLFAGRQLHSLALKMGFDQENFVLGALISFYSNCGTFQDAKTLFDITPKGDIAGTNNMIAAYSFHGYHDEALFLFYEMQSDFETDQLTLSIIVQIYSRLGYLGPAHAKSTCLANYSTWLDLENLDSSTIWSLRRQMPLETWDALLGHARHRHDYDKTIELYKEMLIQGVKPNHVTFHALLSACSNSGRTEDGWEYFNSMTREYGIEPDAIHYACMIDSLGREYYLRDAFELLRSAPFNPTIDMWAALLTAARRKQNLNIAKLAAEELYALEPEKLCYYIALLNMYRSLGMLKEVQGVLDTLQRKGLRMISPSSSIEIKKQSHVFFSGDKFHPQMAEVYHKVDELMEEVSRFGHVDGKVTFLPDVNENEQRIVKYHSERLAIAFGLINTAKLRITLRIMQEHRICEDCHNAVMLMAMATGRKIVVKDADRFHHFESGTCSCGGYW